MSRFTSRATRPVSRLLRSPAFSVSSIVTLALGIGANVAIFSVAYNVMFKPLPYEEPERLVGLWNAAPGLGFDEITQAAALYYTFRDQAESLESIAMYRSTSVSVTGGGKPLEIDAISATHDLAQTLGLRLQAGRWFLEEEDVAGAAPTTVLTDAFARQRFASPQAALGQVVVMDGVGREVVGVTPPGFRLMDFGGDVFLPMRLNRAETPLGQFNYRSLGRLAPGADLESTSTELTALVKPASEEFNRGLSYEMLQEAQFSSFARPLVDDIVGNVRQVLWVLLGTVGVLLLIAFANVANLFLVRAEGRGREVALRTAVGASRLDIFKQFLGESLTLCALGGGLGVVFAAICVRVLHSLAPSSLPRLHEIGINGPVLVFAAVVSLLAGFLFGTFPTLRVRGSKLMGDLKDGGRSATTGRNAHAVRHGLVVAQIGLALVLLIGSGLMMRTFQKLLVVDPGFSAAEEVLSFRVNLPESVIETPADAAQFQRRLIDGLAALPGATGAAATSALPMSGRGSSDGLWVEHHMPDEGQLPPIRRWKFVTGDHFSVLQRPMVAGRPIQWSDLEEERFSVVVTENLAQEYWGSAQEALGKRVKSDPSVDQWWEIVGVASNVYDDGIDQELAKAVYFPSRARQLWGEDDFVYRYLTYLVRTEPGLDPSSLVPQVERLVAGLNPDIPVIQAQTVDQLYRASFARTSFALVMLGIASSVALLLGVVGVYATLSYIISQRTQEFGVRIALGAQLSQVRSMVVKQGLLLAAVGVGFGLAGAFAASRVLAQMVYGVSATDTTTFAAVSAVLLVVVLLAAALAARRATSVDPLTALRAD